MSLQPFQGSDRPTLGVELELQLVDAGSMATRDATDEILSEIPPGFEGSIKPELHSCCVEVSTGICRDTAEVAADLGPKIRQLVEAAGGRGVQIAWGGTHPFTHWLGQGITPTPRYQALAELYRETLLRQSTFGMHVHVGVASGDAAMRACDRIREHLPALLALSANSPFWCGRATGLQAHRIEVLGSAPTGGLPPRLRGWGDFSALVGSLIDCGCIASHKELWWDVRPSPPNGTVEIRLCDMPADLPSVLALTALIQCLVHSLSRAPERDEGDGAEDYRLLLTRQNRWNAARFGLEAGLIDVQTGRRRSARDVVRRLAEHLRGVGEELGCAADLERAWAMAGGPTGADRQLAVYERTGDLAAVVRSMIPDPGEGLHRPRMAGYDHPNGEAGGAEFGLLRAPSPNSGEGHAVTVR